MFPPLKSPYVAKGPSTPWKRSSYATKRPLTSQRAQSYANGSRRLHYGPITPPKELYHVTEGHKKQGSPQAAKCQGLVKSPKGLIMSSKGPFIRKKARHAAHISSNKGLTFRRERVQARVHPCLPHCPTRTLPCRHDSLCGTCPFKLFDIVPPTLVST